MDRKKLLKLIRIFFVLFISSGIGSILDIYYEVFPGLFTNPFGAYDIIRFQGVSVKMPGVPFILILVSIGVFLYLIRKLYRLITAEIAKEG